MNECNGCRYVRPVPGDAHNSCAHPVAEHFGALALLSIMSVGSMKVGPFRVAFQRHGIDNGWAMWPLNFDPVWITECTGRAPVDGQAV